MTEPRLPFPAVAVKSIVGKSLSNHTLITCLSISVRTRRRLARLLSRTLISGRRLIDARGIVGRGRCCTCSPFNLYIMFTQSVQYRGFARLVTTCSILNGVIMWPAAFIQFHGYLRFMYPYLEKKPLNLTISFFNLSFNHLNLCVVWDLL